ncbi:MAG: sigma-70 family RNA polymerase sigma factor [Planctomycetes bacterium]|nr:sigma-70 family RNA polymerase sigma factor [Planctomycetota bacterium]
MLITRVESDEELCIRIQAGDREAGNVLVMRYKRLVAGQAKKMKPPTRIDFDDMIQAGQIALYRAAQTWKPGRNAKYKTLAFVCVRNALRKYLRSTVKQVRECLDCDERAAEETPLEMAFARDGESVEVPGLNELDGTSRAVLTLSFGLEGGGTLGTGDVAERLVLTPNQVNKILQDSLAFLGRADETPWLAPWRPARKPRQLSLTAA